MTHSRRKDHRSSRNSEWSRGEWVKFGGGGGTVDEVPIWVVGSGVGIISESEEVVYTWMTECYLMGWIWAGGQAYNGGVREVCRVGFGGVGRCRLYLSRKRGKVVLRYGEHSYTLVVGGEG